MVGARNLENYTPATPKPALAYNTFHVICAAVPGLGEKLKQGPGRQGPGAEERENEFFLQRWGTVLCLLESQRTD